MNSSIEARLLNLYANLSEAEMYLGSPLRRAGIEALQRRAISALGTVLPESYLDFLSRYDGLAASGVFLYSSAPHPYPDGGSALALVEMNLLARAVAFMDDHIEVGESDMDCYVFESQTSKYQVRDKVAFDNIYQEFNSFDDLLGHVVDLIEQHR
ncbi:YrhA family protein [Stenotrophomonas maltophilia]|uniref:YrhA family protein n=1 Tax=Stenotrophomonas maltophilia TaxID=40324 RepID=UPI0006AC3CE6|nr:YrhA family protein [Stenotrophomonas maltophilia]OBU49716.1 hypothetical protein A9K76_09835 [Stenotrophomonas maltophilia]